MQRFKIQDRVAVYGPFAPAEGGSVYDLVGKRGRVIAVGEDGLLEVVLDAPFSEREPSQRIDSVHPKQCRKLGKKPRRRVWLSYKEGEGLMWAYSSPDPLGLYSEFVEVRRKK